MGTSPPPANDEAGAERGYALVAVIVGLAIMLLFMGVAARSWKQVMQDAREEELIFRGGQIADAVARYQKKNGNAAPPSIEVLVKGKYLRKAYTDPMTPSGRWRFIRPGEALPGGGGPGRPGPNPRPPTGTPPGGEPPGGPPGPGAVPGTGGASLGAFVGVASTSTGKSFRMFNGKTRYSEWLFVAGQPRVVGRQITPAPGGMPGASPGTSRGAPGVPPAPKP